MHALGVDGEEDGFAVAHADGPSGVGIFKEVNVLARAGVEALALDGIEEAGGGAVVEPLGWGGRGNAEFDGDGVTLGGPYLRLVFGKGEALFFAACDDGEDVTKGDSFAGGIESFDEVSEVGPALVVELEVNFVGFMAEDEAEEATEFGGFHFAIGLR